MLFTNFRGLPVWYLKVYTHNSYKYSLPGGSWSVRPSWYSWRNLPSLPSFISVGTTGGFSSLFSKFHRFVSQTLQGLFLHGFQIFRSNCFLAAADQLYPPDIAGRICHLYRPL
jgi:hypothetical protein